MLLKFRIIVLLLLIFQAIQISFADQVSVLTFNVWGLGATPELNLGFTSKKIAERMSKFCDILKEQRWDVVLLQEVWRKADRNFLKSCGYDYFLDVDTSHILDSWYSPRRLGSGLVILSKYPINHSLNYKKHISFRKNGSYRHFTDGEFLAQKGAVFAIVEHPIGRITFANTHIVSNYYDHDYPEQREEQIKLATKYAMRIAKKWTENRLIFGGDLNISRVPAHRGYSPLAQQVPLKFLPDFISLDSDLLPDTQKRPATFSRFNHWNDGRGAGKLDEIYASPQFAVTEQETGVVFNENGTRYTIVVDNEPFPLSDHYGYETTFTLETEEQYT